MRSDLEGFQRRLGYQFSDPALLQQALTHRSASAANNERLEHLGDAVLDLCVSERLYHTFPQASEGDLSHLRSRLVRRESLADFARQLRISEVLVLGESASRSGGHQQDSILADAFEAVLGAVFLESGWEAVSRVAAQLIPVGEELLEQTDRNRDAKSRLQEYCQGISQAPPRYRSLEISGPGHDQNFLIACQLSWLDQEFTGRGNNRKAAEQQAAAAALQYLESGHGQGSQ